jgi:predicted RNA binding protein YcfA (HicA-like mRNA interferase family)
MKVPRDLSGAALVKCFCKSWGYRRVHQVGSHVILDTNDPSPHRIAVPAHKTLRLGTLSGILRDVARHKNVDRAEILASL